ncbi:unnamed protein product, partial [Rotaria socialis]
EQIWWVCECDDNLVSRIERGFKNHLSSQSTLEDWLQWLDSLLNDLLKPYSNLSAEKYSFKLFFLLFNTLQNKLTIYDRINSSNGLVPSISIERRNIQPKISLVVKKDTLSPDSVSSSVFK